MSARYPCISYTEKNSYKHLNDFILFTFAAITAASYMAVGDLILFSTLPSFQLQSEHPTIFLLVLFKLNLIVICTITKSIISIHEWIKTSKSETTISFKDSIENAKNNMQKDSMLKKDSS